MQGRYTGKPAPSITWYRDDKELKTDNHIIFKNTPVTMSLGLMKAKREHSGRYVVVVENSTGSRKGVSNITVVGTFGTAKKTWVDTITSAILSAHFHPFFFPADRPTPPVGPVEFEEVHREYMVISWKPPLDNGGVDISNYIIEKRDVNRDIWTTVTSATTKTTCKVVKPEESGLQQGDVVEVHRYSHSFSFHRSPS